MSARSHILDSGNVARLLKRGFILDSGNVARLAKRIFVVDSGNVARLIFQGIPTGSWTITQAQVTDGVNFNFIGGPGAAGGSISGSGLLSDSNTVGAWYDSVGLVAGTYCTVSVSGFSSDPGQAYVPSFTAHGVTKTTASASSYSYSAGVAIWNWAGANFGFATSGTTAASTP